MLNPSDFQTILSVITLENLERRAQAASAIHKTKGIVNALNLMISDSHPVTGDHSKWRELLRKISNELRSIMDELYPTSLKHLSLSSCFTLAKDKASNELGTEIDVDLDFENEEIKRMDKVLLFYLIYHLCKYAHHRTSKIIIAATIAEEKLIIATDFENMKGLPLANKRNSTLFFLEGYASLLSAELVFSKTDRRVMIFVPL